MIEYFNWENWDQTAVFTVASVMFIVVVSTVLSVGIVKSMIMRQTKTQIIEGIERVSKRIDDDMSNRHKTRCK
jgi:sensor domain CHASE-containing protein